MIKTDDLIRPCGCRSVGECTHNAYAEPLALERMVRAFSNQMLAKLQRKRPEGYRGWDGPENYPTDDMWRMLKEHVEKRQPLDVANFAAMIWNRSEP